MDYCDYKVITTESHLNFPSILLKYSFKITCEPPPGIRQNLNKTLSILIIQFGHNYYLF